MSSVDRFVPLLIFIFLLAGVGTASGQYFQYGKNKIQYEDKSWYYVESAHFDVYYYEPGGEYLAKFTARAAEEAYDQISRDFDYQLTDRIPLLVYPTHSEFAVTNAVDLPTNAEGIGGVTELFKNRVAIPFTGDYREFRRVLHHELVHAVINDMFYGGSLQSIIQNNIRLQIPLWFNEGLAEYQALGWDTNSDMYVRDAILENYLAPIPRLSGYFAYRGGQSVWDYIAEQYGSEKIGEILHEVQLTSSVQQGFRRALGLDLRELSERWHRSLKKVYFPEATSREDLDNIADLIVGPETGNYYSTSPALSPSGDRVAFISTRGGFFDVYLARTEDGKILRKLVDGQDNTRFESLRILEPNLSWSPDGEKIALSVKSGPGDAIAVIDVESGETTHYRVPGVEAIITMDWHPEGEKIAFEGTKAGASDIYVVDTGNKKTVNVTNDLFSDHEPAWGPDGEVLVWYSDRGSYTKLGEGNAETFDMISHDYNQYDIYRIPRSTASRAERLTFTEEWDEKSPQFGAASDKIFYLSNRNGIPNLYTQDLESGKEQPITNVSVGITQFSISDDGSKAALISLKEGTPSVYVMDRPGERRLERERLQPTVWAQRVMGETSEDAPAIALASSSTISDNPFLRDASDGIPYRRRVGRHSSLLAQMTSLQLEVAAEDTVAGVQVARTTGSDNQPEDDPEQEDRAEAEADTVDYGQIDFRNYQFADGGDENEEDTQQASARIGLQSDTTRAQLNPKKYKLNFSPDIIYGAAGFDQLYGVQGVTQMMFSDMLGNHQIFVTTNLLIDLRNSDYYASYSYLPHRTDWSVLGFHTSRLLPNFGSAFGGQYQILRYRAFGGGISARYPLDKFRRFDFEASMLGVNVANVTGATGATTRRLVFYPSVTYTKDNTTQGQLYPTNGHRYALSVTGSPASLRGGNVQFMSVLADGRLYETVGRAYTFAFRLSGGASFGPDPQSFYTAGVSNWINRSFDARNGFPLDEPTDFLFALPVLPLRATQISSQVGSRFGLVNAEFRYPLVAAMVPGPVPVPLYNLQGTFFIDAGSVWGSRRNPEFHVFRRNARGQLVFDDLRMATGIGLRTILFNYPVRFDFAWPFNGRQFGNRRFYLSIGLDF